VKPFSWLLVFLVQLLAFRTRLVLLFMRHTECWRVLPFALCSTQWFHLPKLWHVAGKILNVAQHPK
jgi:hypothetical protein